MSLFGTSWDKIEIKRIPGIGDGPDVPGGSKRPRKLIPAAFDPESADADSDGWRQEGTTARWYGLVSSNPIYKNVLSHFKKIKDPDNDTAWLPVGNTTLEEWLGAIDRVENILLKAPPVELSTMEADLSFVAGHIDLKTRQAQARGVDAPNIASESRRAAAWVKGREIQRKRFGKSSEVLSGDDESVLARAEAFIDALKRKRVERDKKIAQDFELDDDTKRLARNFDITKFLDTQPDYDEWKRDWEQNNPEPVRGDFATEELYEAALEDWDEQRSFDYEELLMSGNSDQELLDALDDIFSFEFTAESGNKYFFSFQYAENASIESINLHFSIFALKPSMSLLTGYELEQIGNGKREISFYDSKVYNDFFSLEEDVRGEQISTIVGARNEQIFAQMGMREIIVSAASGEEMNGATHWPKVGFDWSDESERDHYIKIIEDALDTFSAEVLNDPDTLPTVTAKRNKKTVAVPLFASKEEAEIVLALIEKAKTQRFDDPDRLTAGDLVNWSGAEFWFKKKTVAIGMRKELGPAVAPPQVKWLRIESRVKAVKKPNLPNTPKKPSVGGGGPSKPRALKPAVFDPKSVDVDNDGWHQEGTTAAWFGAGLNNPVVQALKQSLGALGDDDKESSYNAMIATGGYGIFEGAPSPEISTPEADLAWLGGKIVLQQQQQGNASRNPLDGPPPRGFSSDSEFKLEAQWLQGRDEARRRGGVREQVVPTPEIEKLDDQTVIEAIDKAITARKERRAILDAKTRVKADDAASDEVKERAKAFNFEDYPPDDDVELLEFQEWKENYADAPERNTEYPLGGTQEELDAYNESMRQYLQWSADVWDEYVEYRRTQEALKHAELRNALAEIYEYEFLGNDGKTYSTKLDSAMKNETGSFSMSGKIYNESGEEVGFFDRTFLPDGTTVSHDHMKLEEGTRGSQISGILNSRNEIMYQEMGYETITLGALSGQDYNGATHWPKLGYDWLDEDQKELGLRAVEDALTEFALAIKENPDALPMMTKVIEDKDDPDIKTEVRIPIFASREEAESVALLIAIARDQEFDDPDGLTAGDFVNWSGAELFFQQKGIQIELSRAIGGQKESADVRAAIDKDKVSGPKPEAPSKPITQVYVPAKARSDSPEELIASWKDDIKELEEKIPGWDWDYKTGDKAALAISQKQGFDGQPQVLSSEDWDELVKNKEGHTFIFRGMADPRASDEVGKSGADMATQFRSGDHYVGFGIFGNGYYSSTYRPTAEHYANEVFGSTGTGQVGGGAVLDMALIPDAKIIKYDDLEMLINDPEGSIQQALQLLDGEDREAFRRITLDPGRAAQILGYDAIEVPNAENMTPGQRDLSEGETHYVILNRTALAVRERSDLETARTATVIQPPKWNDEGVW